MAEIEVTYFKCGHRTVWGQIGKHAQLRNRSNDPMFCGRCGAFRAVKKTVREKA